MFNNLSNPKQDKQKGNYTYAYPGQIAENQI